MVATALLSPNLKKREGFASTQDDLPVWQVRTTQHEASRRWSIDRVKANLSEAFTSAASVIGLAPLHLPRRKTRSVSYYAFFEGWLLLSQLPDCLSLSTSF